ncbi:8-amino-7-oxononanoate synthase, partial [Staphylococcus aureus]
AAENIHQTLLKHHVFTSYLRYPTVTKPMLRISLSYFHTEQDIDRLFEILHQED